MRKYIATAIAAGALAIGGAASAQDFGSILSNIFGFGTSSQSSSGTPAVVAGTVYQDQYGRRFYYDQYGQQVYLQDSQQQQIVGYDSWGRPIYGTQNSQTQQIMGYDSWGRPIYGTHGTQQQQQQIVGYDSWGRPIYGNSGSYAYGTQPRTSTWDRDGDGIPNSRDRWPDDSRYW